MCNLSWTPHSSRRSLLSGVYARGSKRSNRGSKCVTCRGLHILAVGPFYLVSMPGEVKDPTEGVYV